MCPCAAPVASALSARFSHRSVVITGGLICGFGVAIGAFARNLTDLYLTVGFLNGEWLMLHTQTQSLINTKLFLNCYLLQVWAVH